MNTTPDETLLALWLEDELDGAEQAGVDAWAAGHPEQLQAREEIRRYRAEMARVMPAEVEPPYPDFFNSRVLQGIRAMTPVPAAVPPARPAASFWKGWWMPVGSFAGMALAFWIGSRSGTPQVEFDVSGAPRAIPVDPVVYTPESGVGAEWFASSPASATVIVLSGVSAIPDSTDFSETAWVPSEGDSSSTAATELPEP